MLNIKLCLLDFDGTLFDTIESLYPVFINSFKEVGIKIEESDCLALTRCRLIEGFTKHGGDVKDIQIYYDAIEKYLNSEETVKATKIYYDTIDFLYAAKEKNIPLGIVTSNNIMHVKDVLKFYEIDEDLFQIYVGNRETKNHKPSPDPIYKALELFNKDINKENVIYVGDAKADVDCAISAGVIPILLDRNNEYNISGVMKIHSLNEIFDL